MVNLCIQILYLAIKNVNKKIMVKNNNKVIVATYMKDMNGIQLTDMFGIMNDKV
jgi:hypothetical protein